MLFGQVELRVDAVFAFNDSLRELFVNPEPHQDGCIVLWDCSVSMQEFESSGLIKLILSMFKCISRLQGCINLPKASGKTALLDSINAVLQRYPETRRLYVLTDGEDTCSQTPRVVCGVRPETHELEYTAMAALPAGRREWTDRAIAGGMSPEDAQKAYKAYHSFACARRNDMIAQHCKYLNISMAVIGVGSGVADALPAFLRTGTIPVGFVPHDATPEDVTAVVSTTVRRSRERVFAPEIVTPANAGAAVADEVAEVVKEAARTTTHAERRARPEKHARDGPPFDVDRQRAYVEWVVRHTVSEPVRGETASRFGDATAQIEWLVLDSLGFFADQLARRATVDNPIAGDLLCGRQHFTAGVVRCGLVAPPDDLSVSKHRLAGVFKKAIQRLSVDPQHLVTQLAGLREAFSAEIAADTVGALFRDCGEHSSELSLGKEDGLPQLKEGKRFYRFRSTATYACVHYVLNHRTERCSLGRDAAYASLPLVHVGNVSRLSPAAEPRKRTAEAAQI